jgi:hypothetical protein
VGAFHDDDSGQILLGDGVVTIRRKGITSPAVAKVLGVQRDRAGEPTRIVLDRLIHDEKDVRFGPWEPRGVYVTDLVRAKRKTKDQRAL